MSDFVVSRTFDAPRKLVWAAYTEPKHLMHWWGPKGFKMLKCSLDLRVGGVFHYGMQSPDGKTMWGKFIYREIVAPERIVHTVMFSDENQGITRHPMAPVWPLVTLTEATFTEANGKTTIDVRWRPENATAEEQAMFDGAHASMRGGWSGTMDQLDAYLATAKAA
jgi:uncharacterized protein YndB with AHSA1/START domain